MEVIPSTVTEIRSFRWSAIFAGAVAAMATWALLYALGLAIGLTTLNPEHVKGAGIFTGVWGAVSPLVALFVGGLVAGRGAGLADRPSGALHGFVMWGLATLAGGWLLVNLVGSVLGGAVSAGKSVAQLGGKSIASAAQSFGVDANDALAPVNQRLQAEGKPTVTADQLQAATRDVLRSGSLDRNALTTAIANNTALSQNDASEVANRVESQFDNFKSNAGQKVQAGAMKAADTTAKAMWGLFVALILGLIAAVLGGLVGVGRVRHIAARTAPEPTGRTTRPLTPREA